VIAMQISTNAFYDTAAKRISTMSAQAQTLQTEIATGKKYQSPSQNPVLAQQIAEFDRKDADAAVYKTNLDLAGSLLSQADGTLDSIKAQLNHALEIAVQARNDTQTDASRKILGNELQSVVGALVGLANTRNLSGQPLFGTASSTAAVTDNGDGTFTFAPTDVTAVPIADGQTVEATESAKRIFDIGGGKDTLSMLTSLATALQAGGNIGQAISDSIDGLTKANDQVALVQSSVGARGARVDLQTTLQTNASTERASLRSSLEETDVPDTIVKLQQLMTALSASQASFSKLSSLSLFDYIK